jgi:hypothetical protein
MVGSLGNFLKKKYVIFFPIGGSDAPSARMLRLSEHIAADLPELVVG